MICRLVVQRSGQQKVHTLLTLPQGHEVPLDVFAYTGSENMRPEAFKARFIPRSEEIVQVLSRESAVARQELSIYDSETKLTMQNWSEMMPP